LGEASWAGGSPRGRRGARKLRVEGLRQDFVHLQIEDILFFTIAELSHLLPEYALLFAESENLYFQRKALGTQLLFLLPEAIDLGYRGRQLIPTVGTIALDVVLRIGGYQACETTGDTRGIRAHSESSTALKGIRFTVTSLGTRKRTRSYGYNIL
jgi:hypothetical protein